MSLQKYVRQVSPRNESYIPPVDKVQNFFTEAYSFFPKSEEEISTTLADWPHESVADVIKLFTYLKGKGDETPINIDLKKKKDINVSRLFKADYNISDIKSGANLDTVRIKFATPTDARKTVAKVKKISKPFARKIQILTVGEQRAKVMGKSKVAAIFKKGKNAIRRTNTNRQT